MRTIYIFDIHTGRYLRTITANDPIRDKNDTIVYGKLSADMTETAPPECPAGHHLRWNGTAWETIADPVSETPQIMTEEERWASLTPAQRAEEIRSKRDGMIEDVMWRVERYQTQTALGVTTTDSETQYRAVLAYIEALRQVPEQEGFPDVVEWPTLQNA